MTRVLLLVSAWLLWRAGHADEAYAQARARFVHGSYNTASTLAMYAGYGTARTILVIGMAGKLGDRSPKTLAGLGYSSRVGSPGHVTFILAGARASDEWLLELYALPALVAGELAVSGTIELAQVLDGAPGTKFRCDPAVHILLGSTRVGATYSISARSGLAAAQAAGPSLRLPVAHGHLTLEWLAGIVRARAQGRVTMDLAL
jgi:hypothetical protein